MLDTFPDKGHSGQDALTLSQLTFFGQHLTKKPMKQKVLFCSPSNACTSKFIFTHSF